MPLAEEFTSWDQLKGASTLVVLATAGGQETQADAHSFPWTTTTFHVDRILSNQEGVEVYTVLVRQLGPAGPDRVLTAGFPIFQSGAQYLLFLTPTTTIPDVYYPVGSFQGVFTVTADGRVSSLSEVTGVVVQDVALDAIIDAIAAAPGIPLSRGKADESD